MIIVSLVRSFVYYASVDSSSLRLTIIVLGSQPSAYRSAAPACSSAFLPWLLELTRPAVFSLCDFPEHVILRYAFGKCLKAVFSFNCVFSSDSSSFLSTLVVD